MRKSHHPDKRQVLSFLKAMTGEGTFPSPAELDAAMQMVDSKRISARAAAEKLARLRRPVFTPVPISGTISAGSGDSAEPADLGELPVNLEALNIRASSRTFALRVRGDSMTGALIADGDMVIVETREPKIGEIVAALIDGKTTLKRFVAQDGALFLRAENPRYPDLIPMHQLTIQGVVRAVVRVCDRPRPVL